jgi:hypothetical protein
LATLEDINRCRTKSLDPYAALALCRGAGLAPTHERHPAESVMGAQHLLGSIIEYTYVAVDRCNEYVPNQLRTSHAAVRLPLETDCIAGCCPWNRWTLCLVGKFDDLRL